MTSRHVNSITGRLSLRSPQRRSLEILDRVMEIVLAAGHGPHCRCLQYLAAQGGLTAQQILYRVMLSLGYPHLACAIWLKPDVYIGAVKHLSVGVAIIEWGAELRRRSELDIGQPMTLFAQRMAEAHA